MDNSFNQPGHTPVALTDCDRSAGHWFIPAEDGEYACTNCDEVIAA
jgi:hypothetical protein